MKWLKWLTENTWAIIIIGGVLVQMFQAIMKKKGGGGEEPTAQPKEYEFEDPELAERTRRIREEIQRKIEQRARGYTQPVAPSTDAEAEAPPVISEVNVAPAASFTKAASRAETQRQAEILEQQVALMERLREAQQMKAAAEKRTEFEQATMDHTAERRSATRSTVLGDLRTPEALRRAFILREVLGPPVALRR